MYLAVCALLAFLAVSAWRHGTCAEGPGAEGLLLYSVWQNELLKRMLEQGARQKRRGESRCEAETREVLEQELFPGHRFPNVRPAWLVNPRTGRRLEIDCYCEELRLGVEVNGRQHAEFVPAFHKGLADFHAQVDRDRTKRRVCAERGVLLVSVPHTVRGRAAVSRFLRGAIWGG